MTNEQHINIFCRICVTTAFVLLIGFTSKACVDGVVAQAEIQEKYYSAPISQEQQDLVHFFVRHGSPEPERMAAAVSKTRRPKTLAAIAVVESRGNPKAVGDNGDSKGAFQVQQRHWQPVPESPEDQARQAEQILEELLATTRGRLRPALIKYNAGENSPPSAKRYADRVLALRREL